MIERNPIDGTQPHERLVCGAKTRSGAPCQKAPLAGRTRCKFHGGLTPRGVASPHFKDGRRSKALPAQLAARYQDALNDPDLLNLRDELALTDTMIDAALAQLADGGGLGVFRELVKSWSQLRRLQATGRTAEAGVVLQEVGTLIERGGTTAGVMDETVRLIDQRRKLVESEQKRLVAMQQMLTSEEAMAFLGVVMAAVRTNVSDRQILDAIGKDIEKHALNVGASQRPTRRIVGIDDEDTGDDR